MKTACLRIPALSLLLSAASLLPASAGLISLTSPDGKWNLVSDEFGAYGEAVTGSVAQRDFGTGLTHYSWASSLLLTEGGTARQWITGIDLDYVGQSLLSAANVISDSTAGNVRTSAFSVPGFANLRINLVQTATNAGVVQRYSFTNNRATALTLGVTSYHDVDLDENTAGNNTISVVDGTLKFNEGARNIFFAPSAVGYAGYFAGFSSNGVTTTLDKVAFDNFGIPAGTANGFWDVSAGTVGANLDVNNDKISDIAQDSGYLFQNNLIIPAGSTMTLEFGTLPVPEPSSAILAVMGIGLVTRRRRS
jgi:hypothetical protein